MMRREYSIFTQNRKCFLMLKYKAQGRDEIRYSGWRKLQWFANFLEARENAGFGVLSFGQYYAFMQRKPGEFVLLYFQLSIGKYIDR